MPRVVPTPEEEREWYAERAAILQCALRHLAAAWHRKHTTVDGQSWAHCEEHFCKMAHDACEGRMKVGTRAQSGVVISLAKKEA